MNYYYDLTLDFLENSYPFYEIQESDEFLNIKKIPLFQVDSKTLKDFLLYQVKVDRKFLDQIKNKTITLTGTITYAAILADKNNAWAFKFKKSGECVNYSALALNEELNLLEVIYTVKKINIAYEKLGKKDKNKLTRKEEKIKNLILKELTKLYEEHNIAKMQYLYLEWCDKLESNINVIYEEMQKKINNFVGEKEEKVSKLIEISYNNV